MIELHQFPRAWGINPSPFCMKVESYLTLAKLPFRLVDGDLRKTPKGKLPVIVDQGRAIPDSGQILDYLKSTYGDPLDAALTADQRALGHVVRRTCEESLFFCIVFSRWIDPVGWPVLRATFVAMLPRLLAPVLLPMLRRMAAKSLHGQGTGRHSRDEIYALAAADLDSIERLLPPEGFLFGPNPTTFDISVYAMLASLVKPPIETKLNTLARSRPRLVAFVADMDRALAAA